MPDREVKLTNEVGLHARPAAVFSKAAAGFSSDVTVAKGADKANAKSIMAVLKLDVKKGDSVTVTAEGDDAEGALEELVALLESL